ncbi:hypothetical protein E3J38_06535 [candidate division TA06 bacterium]|uniref:Restriction endonuclease type IV Mrr domain-containing protein n=1 Tax=candidate division TA06 bacterium TaxID=2250710 RepID=A0A523UQD9_UNCT6|nr:MAG: hypothetical protein E3J62_09540 [candidate division TA06 bacterium]TET79940.1 MAG: hypothetical protein E3J38_06535 [candidate division TA06 bacterium]
MKGYIVRAGGGQFVGHFLKGDFAGIGWIKAGDLTGLTLDQMREQLKKTFGGSPGQIGAKLGAFRKFVLDIQEGDWILTPDLPRSRYIAGRVRSGVRYQEKPKDGCPYKHRRSIDWTIQIPRDELSDSLKHKLGSLQTIFEITAHLEQILEKEQGLPVDPEKIVVGDKLRKKLLERLRSIEPKRFEAFVGGLLEVLGFTGEVTQYVGDGGVDYQGTLLVSDILEVPVKVQVKRVKGAVGAPTVRMLRGTLAQDEFGIIMTTGHFPASARQEAARAGLKTIGLVAGERLMELVLENFETLDPQYRRILGLKRMVVMQ